jgi:hypothetical protein
MVEPADSTPPDVPATPPVPPVPATLRLGVAELPRAHHAVAGALGEAGVGGQQLTALFASGLRATCVGCGITVTGTELGELVLAADENSDHRLTPKLERLRLGYCPRADCEARFFNLELSPVGQFDPAKVLARAMEILGGNRKPLLNLKPSLTPATRKATRRLALIALITLVVAFVTFRLIYYRSQPIPFVQPKSPFQVDPASVEPVRR